MRNYRYLQVNKKLACIFVKMVQICADYIRLLQGISPRCHAEARIDVFRGVAKDSEVEAELCPTMVARTVLKLRSSFCFFIA